MNAYASSEPAAMPTATSVARHGWASTIPVGYALEDYVY